MSSRAQQEPVNRRLWLPPVVSVAALFAVFMVAMLVRRTGLADEARPVMIGLSATTGGGIALYGAKLIADARAHGWASALAGAIMVFLGGYTIVHVFS